MKEELKKVLYGLDWMQILNKAIEGRKTSWNFGAYNHPVIEWRNASDEVCVAVVKALEEYEDNKKELAGEGK